MKCKICKKEIITTIDKTGIEIEVFMSSITDDDVKLIAQWKSVPFKETVHKIHFHPKEEYESFKKRKRQHKIINSGGESE